MSEQTMDDVDPQLAGEPIAGAPLPLYPQMTRAFLWVSALACAVSAALLLALPLERPASLRLAAMFGAFGLVAAACTRLGPKAASVALTAIFAGATLAIAAAAMAMGWGLATPGLPVSGLMICVLCAAVGWRAGLLLAGVATTALIGLAWQAAAPAALGHLPEASAQLGTHLIAVAAGLAAGVMISRALRSTLRAAQEREQRFRRLLALAADAYWEIDRDYRLVAAADHGGTPGPLSRADGLGSVPWELPQFGCDPDTLDAIQADLETRLAFRDQPVRWTVDDDQERAYLVSGEPRFDERGIFTGYWGVARDVSAMQEAHEALAATETRYQDLFSRIPTPLVLHRGGRIIDANPAAVAMFGHGDLRSMIGTDMLASFEGGDSRERARRRIEALQAQPLGTALPVTDFRLVVDQRVVSVRAITVRVEAEGGPAMLAIFVDDSERLAAEEAVRRSEAMLSHLVATSPDLITLTDLGTGRYAMVNNAFERISGWTAAEAVGRTSIELGIWGSDAAREDFVRRLRENGVVSDLPVPFISKSGATFSLVVSAARFVMDRRDYMVINARDVTEKERERLERDAILRNASVGIAVTRDRRFVLANPHFEQIYGWNAGELVGQPGMVVWTSPEDYAEVGALVGPVLARGEPIELERAGRRRDGSTFLARIRGRAIDPDHPTRAGTVWIVEDVTERREFEQALARARDAAEAASRAKSAFLANTSHETAHPAQRHDRPGAAGPRRRPGRRAAAPVPGPDRRQRAVAGGHHLRHPRPVQDRGRQAAGRGDRVRPRRGVAPTAAQLRGAGRRTRARTRAGDRPRGRRHGRRRPFAGAPGRHQLPHQRAEVHRAGPGRSARPAPGRRATGAPGSAGHRAGHRRDGPRAIVPAVHPGRRLDHPALRRYRPGPVDLPRAGGA